MKKLNTTYLDNLVSKILKETLEEKADSLVSKIKGDICECGGTMYEGECNECGYSGGQMEEDIHDEGDINGEFDYVGENEYIDDIEVDVEDTDEDKEKSVKKSVKHGMEEQETQEGNAFSGALAKAKKEGKDSFEVDGKKYSDKESYRLTESEMICLIEKIVKDQKNKIVKDPAEKNNIKGIGGSPRGLEVYKKAHNGSGKENNDYIKDVTKKMKDYLKDGSKGEYEMNPKIFPVGNGELEKMDKKAFEMTDDLEDFNYEIAGLNLPTPDAIEFNEDFMEKLYKGDSTTGNAPGGNALESKANDRFNKLRKKNTLKKLKDQSYNRVSQPVYNEKSGTEKGKGVNIKLESIEDKKTKQINEEFDRMKSLMGYNQKTQ